MKRAALLLVSLVGCDRPPELRPSDCAGFEAMAKRQAAAARQAAINSDDTVIEAQKKDAEQLWSSHTGGHRPDDCFVHAITQYWSKLDGLEISGDFIRFEERALEAFDECREQLTAAGRCH